MKVVNLGGQQIGEDADLSHPRAEAKDYPRDLTSPWGGLKYRQFPAIIPARSGGGTQPGFMTPIPSSPVPEKRTNIEACKHPRVQIVAREEDAEFVECMECGDIFEASEFEDMNIEETKLGDEA
jgi:hypothetical protein